MKIHIVFRGLTETWEEELSVPGPISCREAASAALERRAGRPAADFGTVVYTADGKRLDPETPLWEGACVSVFVLVGGG